MEAVISNGKGGSKIFNDDELYSPIEIATRLKITKEAVYNWIRNDRVKHIRVGKRAVRIKGSEINKIIEIS